MTKAAFCICENKGADSCAVTVQLISTIVFAIYVYSTIPLRPTSKFQALAIFFGCNDWFLSDLVGNLDKFSCDLAHLSSHLQD